MLPTNKNAPTTTNRSDGYQVLNISNVNAQNEVVLNDENLLSLIQQYPFLYNPHVRPHNDPDYDAWAWEQISKAFNRTYENLNRNVWYTTDELIERWKVLQPIVRSLSKINNIKSLPDTLRQTVVKMSVPMEEKPIEYHAKKPLSAAQKTLLDYEPFLKSLPLADRRRLEAEMMELILNSELNSKGTIKMGLNELQLIEFDCNEFLKSIGLDELHMDEIDKANNEQNNIPLMKPIEVNNSDNMSNGSPPPPLPPLLPSLMLLQTNTEELEPQIPIDSQPPINEPNIKMEQEEPPPIIECILPTTDENDDNLLKPLASKKWVPLTRWRDYVRKCRVRIKRYVAEEDDMPLAKIKREKIDAGYILPN